jgi:Cu/Ag efflux protein CusF
MNSRRIVRASVVTALVLASGAVARAQNHGQEIAGRLVSIVGDTMTIEWSGRMVQQSVTPKTMVVFHRDQQDYPNPSIADLRPGMNVSFKWDNNPPERIHVNLIPPEAKKNAGGGGKREVAPAPAPEPDRRDNPRGSVGGGGGSRELMVKILEVDERRGEFQADVAGRKQSFVADNPRDLHRWREGDLVVVTLERKGGDEVVTAIRAGGLSGKVIDVDRRRGDIRIEVDGRPQMYSVDDKDLLESVRVGDRVRFEIAQIRGRQVITSIH